MGDRACRCGASLRNAGGHRVCSRCRYDSPARVAAATRETFAEGRYVHRLMRKWARLTLKLERKRKG